MFYWVSTADVEVGGFCGKIGIQGQVEEDGIWITIPPECGVVSAKVDGEEVNDSDLDEAFLERFAEHLIFGHDREGVAEEIKEVYGVDAMAPGYSVNR